MLRDALNRIRSLFARQPARSGAGEPPGSAASAGAKPVTGSSPPGGPDASSGDAPREPRHFGELWQAIQSVAVEEDPSFAERNVVSYYHQGAEAQKDILRWIAIYQRRVDPDHTFTFPAHHPRYRNVCLVRRAWPSGLRWEAFDEATWFRLPVAPEVDRERLERAIDRLLDAPERASAD